MDEKILIRSKKINVTKMFTTIVLIGCVLTILASILCINYDMNYFNEKYPDPSAHKHSWECYAHLFRNEASQDIKNGGLQEWKMDCLPSKYDNAFEFAMGDCFAYSYWGLFCLIPVVVSIIVGIGVYFKLRAGEIVVTDKRIYGTIAGGKRVDLPIDTVSAVGMGALKSITISTASGRIGFSAIKNRNEIHDVVSKLLVERQKQPTSPVQTTASTQTTSNVDELKKYKELLDQGIITQEEFNAKKKQLLGL